MTPATAPIYVRAFDLATWVLGHTENWSASTDPLLRIRLRAAAVDLLDAVACALTFPSSRARDRDRADRLVVRIRILLRLAHVRSRLSARQLRFAAGELEVIGRMIGGWQRKARLRRYREKGSKPKTAPTA